MVSIGPGVGFFRFAARFDGGNGEPGIEFVASEVSGLPATFVPNVGQAHPDVLFEGGVLGRDLSVTTDGVVFAGGERLTFTGTDGAMRVRGVDQAAGIVNFLVGADPDNWRVNVPSYRAVRYENLYPGVDVVLTMWGGAVTAEFQQLPKADLSKGRVGHSGRVWHQYSAVGVVERSRGG